MRRCWIGCALVVIGLALAVLGGPLLGSDLRPVSTGFIAVGLVMAGAGLVEHRLDAPRRNLPHDAGAPDERQRR
jgi:hypothetical protein